MTLALTCDLNQFDNKSFPKFARPNEIGNISSDKDRNLKFDKSRLQILNCPQTEDGNTIEIPFNLSRGYDSYVEKIGDERIDNLLKWVLYGTNPNDRLNLKQSLFNTDFICWRGLLTKVAATLYQRKESWMVCVTKFRDIYFLCEFDTPQKKLYYENRSDREKLMTYWGHSFEKFVTSSKDSKQSSDDDDNGRVNCYEEFGSIVRTKLGDHRLIFGAEIDCVDPSNGKYIELKTNRVIETPRQYDNFKRKLLKWWIQSFLIAMPWFGVDIGGTLVKLVYFEPTDNHPDDEQETPLVARIRKYLTSNTYYGDTGVRDFHLQLNEQRINGRVGTLHFIRFPVSNMLAFIKLAKSKGLATFASTVSATGGGAFKFENIIRDALNLELFKYDELQSVISGIQYIVENHPCECYYFLNPLEDFCEKVAFSQPLHPPYLVVNVGSGVSILCVDGFDEFRRVTGTSLGGGMFHGLCCLLTGCKTFEEALDLASRGDNSRVDKLIKDIYGGDYDLFNLPGDTVAASFGNMIDPDKRQDVKPEDLARSALVTITNNIGSIARMCAQNFDIEKVLFVGNFLRVNTLSMKLLASAMDYWSNGKIKALFLEHEGYFGAVGCLMNLMKFSEFRKSKQPSGDGVNSHGADYYAPNSIHSSSSSKSLPKGEK